MLAGEMSGHLFFADRYFGFDDAIYASLRLLEILANDPRPLSAMLADVPKTFTTPELRVDCPDAIKFGVVAAVKRNTVWDWVANAIGLAGLSTPTFWLGIMLILLVSVQLGWLPPSGYVPLTQNWEQSLATTIMPAFISRWTTSPKRRTSSDWAASTHRS